MNVDGAIRLALALVNSGIECQDQYFLRSEWCAYLKDVLYMRYRELCERETHDEIGGGQCVGGDFFTLL